MKRILSLCVALFLLVLWSIPSVYADSFCEENGHIPDVQNPHKCEVCATVFEDCFDDDNNNLCDMCFGVICCLNDYLIWEADGEICRQYCKKCKKVHIEQAHIYDQVGGTACLNCKAECTHTDMLWETTPEEHYGQCRDCTKRLYEWSPHDTVDGVCTVCGYGGCDHQTDGKYNMGTAPFGHELSCCLCDEVVLPWSPHEYDADGVCTVCGYVECPHGTVEEAKDVTVYFNASEHWYKCNLCEALYAEQESHSFANGVCTVCGAKPCETGKHNIVCSVCLESNCVCDDEVISTTLRLHICSKCNIIAGCQDNNGDCLCDYCKTEHHNFRYETTETEHRVICRSCGYISNWEAHYDLDAFVGCDYCAYGKPQAQTKVEKEEGAPDAVVELPIGSILSEEEKELIADGVNVDLVVSITNTDETVTAQEKEAVTATIAQNDAEQTVAIYLDIDLSKKVGDGEASLITETNAPVTIVIDIPEEFQSANRQFSVIRVHDGVSTELPDLDNNPRTVTIETDRFSTYALIYTDQTIENTVPDTEAADGTADEAAPDDRSYADADTDGEKDNGFSTAYVVGAVVAVVIVIAVCLAVAIRKKQSKNA